MKQNAHARPPSPPRLALWILERRVSEHEREFFIGDLHENFHSWLAAGVPPAQARRRFWREAMRAALRIERDPESLPLTRGLMRDISLDLTLAIRRLRRAPGFTLAASLTLALGIGAACAIVSVARPALWGALPFRDAERIVTLREVFGDGSAGRLGYLSIKDLERRVGALQAVAAATDRYSNLQTAEGTVRLTGMAVTASWLEVMGVRPSLGRGFLPEEDRPNATRVVVLTDALWRQRFSADSTIIGRSVTLTDVPHQVVGVLPPSYESVLQAGVELLTPLRYADTLGYACRDCRHLQAVARVRSGIPLADAARQVDEAWAEMGREFAATYGRNGIRVTPLRAQLLEGVRSALLALVGAAALLLVIALANTTNLFVAKTIRRMDESTVRTALGASRWRLVRGMLIEAQIVAALGALFGLAIASAVIGSLVALAPPSLPRIDQVRLDASVIRMAAALAVSLGMVAGLFPPWVLRIGRSDGPLQMAGRSVVRGGQDAVRRALVVLEMALAVLLLGGAGILVRSVERLLAVELGFAPEQRLTMALGVGGPRYRDDATVWATWRTTLDVVTAVPGVQGAALTSQLPLSADFDTYGLRWEGREQNSSELSDGFRFAVTPNYAQVMGLRVRRGRFLDAADVRGGAPVVVINEHLARQVFGDRTPLGARLRMGADDSPWRTVVGVVNDVQHPTLDAAKRGQVYLPLDQNAFADGHVRLVVHTEATTSSVVGSVREAIRRADANIAVAEVTSMSEVVSVTARQRLFARIVFQVFSAAALALAAIGIFGVMSGMVGERTREIGVRSALGASQRQIVFHFIRQGAMMIGGGLLIGGVGAVVLGDALKSLAYGVSARDPVTLLAVAALLSTVAFLATWWPARRAAGVEAAVALRGE